MYHTADELSHLANLILKIAACKAFLKGKEKLKTCFRQRERKREGKRRVTFQSFPSKDRGTKTKHVKTVSIRLLLSSLSFQILKDDKYHTCLAWGCSLCNQTTTVSYRLVSESHNKELSSSWYTDQQQVYNLLNQNLSTIRYQAEFNFIDPEKAPTTWLHLPRLPWEWAQTMHITCK